VSLPRSVERAKSVINKTLNTTATVYRKQVVTDDMGGQTDSYVTAGSYPCSFARYPITPVERETSVTVIAVAFWQFVFPDGTDIRTSDRLICNGRSFEVVSSATGSLSLATRVLAQEIT
jgi:hypothetical protein